MSDIGEGQDHERQFLVGDEEGAEDGLEDEVRSFRSSVSMDNEIEQSKLGTFMGNSAARASYLDVRSPEGSSRHVGDSGTEQHSGTEQQQPGKKGLASKAGIIIVSLRFC